MQQLPKRILSIDVLRAINMFLMIFVNDVAGVGNIPNWIGHTEAEVDGMGFSDLIFPAFLFIVGLSLPFAIQARIKNGKSFISICLYIILRVLALVVMGFFHVNLENYNHEQALLSYPIFVITLTLGFFLIWLDYPQQINSSLKYGLVTLGVIVVAAMAYLYKGGNAANVQGLKPHWWGILGLIGWAYLFVAFTYFLTKGKLIWLVSAFIIFALINITTHLNLLHIDLWQIGDASSITLMLGGVLVTTCYSFFIAKKQDFKLWVFLAFAAIACIAFGFIIRPFGGGISKIYATPAWVFICMGISNLTFMVCIYLVDYKGRKNWFNFIKPAGTSTLTCYLMPYLLYSVFSLFDFNFPHYFNYGLGGIVRSFFIAFLVIRMVALMERRSLRLRI